MKPGVYYLYEYHNDQKTRNVGFLKISLQSSGFFIQICSRGIPVLHNENAILSALHASDKLFYFFKLIPLTCENHAITGKFEISQDLFDNQHPFHSICGFLIELPNHSLIAATEDDILFSPSLLTEKKNDLPKHAPCACPTENSVNPVSPPVQKDCSSETEEPLSPSENTEDCSSGNEEKTSSSEDIGEPQNKPVVRKIQRSDLTILPRCQWHLANNSFLMHGYHNYNHLLLIEEDGHTLLGVPGIYDRREARAAELFGFPVFSDTYAEELRLSEADSQPLSHFGYWCRKL